MSSSNRGSLFFVLFATCVAATGGFLFGYDTAVINGANTYITAHWDLNPYEEGLVGASAILGCIPGAMFAGLLSDRFGRKRMLFLCAILFAVSGILSAFPQNLRQFLIARFISGLGIGASSMICPVYIAELAPEKWRGRLGSLFQLGIVVGIFLTLFINKTIQGCGDDAWNTSVGWRWMLGIEAIPAVIFMFLLLAVPESPRWLAQNNREEEARQILYRATGPEDGEKQMAEIREAIGQEEGRFSELFAGAYSRPLVLALVLMVCQQFCGINAIIYYSTKIFETAGADKTAAFTSTAWVGVINVLATIAAIAFVDKAGRRPLLLLGTAVQTFALGMIGWMFLAKSSSTRIPDLLVKVFQTIGSMVAPDQAALFGCIILYIAAFGLAMGPIGWLFCSEVFPNRVRGRAMSMAAMSVWISCYIVAQTFPMLKESAAIGPARTFWIYGAVSLFSFLFVLFLIPETKGRTLEQIERYWKGRSTPHA
jgi:SP family arabinose:H+ symporter-like MFS transporter